MLTLPLSSVRMWSMARGGKNSNDVTSCVVGALLASCGWVDCLLYTLTRQRLLTDTMKTATGPGQSQSRSQSDHNSKGGSILQTTTYTVRNQSAEAPKEQSSDTLSGISGQEGKSTSEVVGRDRSPSPSGSCDPILLREQRGAISKEGSKEVCRNGHMRGAVCRSMRNGGLGADDGPC